MNSKVAVAIPLIFYDDSLGPHTTREQTLCIQLIRVNTIKGDLHTRDS